jgi:hypothetical protein
MSETDNTATLVGKRDEQATVSQAESDNIHTFGRIPRVGIEPVAPSELPLAIEDYALIGDCTTAALVGRNGSIDWLCWPRFDSNACFAALLGTSEHGRWRIWPANPAPCASRAYRDGTMVLETIFETADGCVALIDFMPIGGLNSSVVRLVEGRRGTVAMRLHLTLRFDYGATIPWVTRLGDDSGLRAVAGSSERRLPYKVRISGPSQSSRSSKDNAFLSSSPTARRIGQCRPWWIGVAPCRRPRRSGVTGPPSPHTAVAGDSRCNALC